METALKPCLQAHFCFVRGTAWWDVPASDSLPRPRVRFADLLEPLRVRMTASRCGVVELGVANLRHNSAPPRNSEQPLGPPSSQRKLYQQLILRKFPLVPLTHLVRLPDDSRKHTRLELKYPTRTLSSQWSRLVSQNVLLDLPRHLRVPHGSSGRAISVRDGRG